MLSQIAICNAALAKLGESAIIDLADDSKKSRACNEAFDRTRDAMLRSHRWSFAMARTQLAPLATPPAFEYATQYLLPADLLRLDFIGDLFVGLDLSNYRNSNAAEYRIEGRNLLTDINGKPGTALNIRYIRRVTDTTIFDPLFDECLACKLAIELCNSLTQSDSLKQAAAQEFRQTLLSAVRINAVERPPEPLPGETWEMSRL